STGMHLRLMPSRRPEPLRDGALVHPLPQFLARLEMRDVLAGQRHGRAGLRIAARARRTVMQRETAEAADLDAVAGRQRATHLLDDVAHREFDIGERQMLLALRERGN